MSADRIVRMANDIAKFMESKPSIQPWRKAISSGSRSAGPALLLKGADEVPGIQQAAWVPVSSQAKPRPMRSTVSSPSCR
jgi:hypothetical protein